MQVKKIVSMTLLKKYIFFLSIICFPFIKTNSLYAQDNNCFGILAGRLTTVDGSVLMGHNEDDGGEQMLNIYVASKDQERGTNKFLWAEFPGMEVADAFMNEYGVCIASDNCPSREDREDYTNGGILFNIRFDVAKYAKSARGAVYLIGKNVEKYGYKDSGRSYIVADTKEGWVVSIVRGRHWIAQRVPDDKIMTIPNYYVIDKVNLEDKENFWGSSDIISYAISRGWYNPKTDGDFSFRKVYSAPKAFKSSFNTRRHSQVLSFLAKDSYHYDVNKVEFTITPKHQVCIQDLIDALSIHDTNIDSQPQQLVCNNRTILSIVFQLRNWMPRNLGCIMWTCPGKPCSEIFVPWYLGMTKSPKGWTRFDLWTEAEKKHLTDVENKRSNYPNSAYWKYVKRSTSNNCKHNTYNSPQRIKMRKIQQKLFKKQIPFEQKLGQKTEIQISKELNAYTAALVKKY